jgi:hypothetical protein
MLCSMSTLEIGVIVFIIGIVAMFGWFTWLFATDPANIWGRRPRQPDEDKPADGGN